MLSTPFKSLVKFFFRGLKHRFHCVAACSCEFVSTDVNKFTEMRRLSFAEQIEQEDSSNALESYSQGASFKYPPGCHLS